MTDQLVARANRMIARMDSGGTVSKEAGDHFLANLEDWRLAMQGKLNQYETASHSEAAAEMKRIRFEALKRLELLAGRLAP